MGSPIPLSSLRVSHRRSDQSCFVSFNNTSIVVYTAVVSAAEYFYKKKCTAFTRSGSCSHDKASLEPSKSICILRKVEPGIQSFNKVFRII